MQFFTVIPLNSAVYLLYNIVVWAVTGICFIRLVFYFVCVFWGSSSGLESLPCCRHARGAVDAQEG